MGNKLLKAAIIGDPHFFQKKEGPAQTPISYNSIDLKADIEVNTPWYDLVQYIIDNKITADILICVGDLTTRADVDALMIGWKELCRLGELLNTKCLISTVGNHDVFSRTQEVKVLHSPILGLDQVVGLFEPLKLLQPPFPIVEFDDKGIIEHYDLRTQYFGNSFSLFEKENYRIIAMNTCSEHGADEFQYQRGTFPYSVKLELERYFNKVKKDNNKINILVCHHAPQLHSAPNLGNYDFLAGADVLIEVLESFDEDWLIIHGHKHHAKISYAAGSASSPIVFSAASIGSITNTLEKGMRNQFYVIDLELSESRLLGKVNAWTWFFGQSWRKATPKNDGIYDGCGFGYRENLSQFVGKIHSLYEEKHQKLDWKTVTEELPELNYITPNDLDKLQRKLQQKYNLIVQQDSNGSWLTIEELFK